MSHVMSSSEFDETSMMVSFFSKTFDNLLSTFVFVSHLCNDLNIKCKKDSWSQKTKNMRT